MKLIKTENPSALEILQKNVRRYNLDTIKVHKVNNKRYCAWCYVVEVGNRAKYCSNQCRRSSYICFNPSSLMAITYLLYQQEFKCNMCNYDWGSEYTAVRGVIDRECFNHLLNHDPFTFTNAERITRRIKTFFSHSGRALEMDHTIPIALGGLGLGVENHQVICKACHLEKTKKDLGDIAQLKKNLKSQTIP